MIAPIDKIKGLLNEDIVSLFGNDIINNSYIEAYKIVSAIIADEYVIESLSNSGLSRAQYILNHISNNDAEAVYNDLNFSENRRVLSVMRKNTYGTPVDDIYYTALKIPYEIGSTQADNPNSIYYENDKYNPKYYFTDLGRMEIIPKNTFTSTGEKLPQAKILFLTFPDFNTAPADNFRYTFELNGLDFSSITKDNEKILFYGIPGGAKELVYVQMALNLLQNYMSDFTFDEEDVELVSLAKEYATVLTLKKQEELEFIMPKYTNKRAQ